MTLHDVISPLSPYTRAHKTLNAKPASQTVIRHTARKPHDEEEQK